MANPTPYACTFTIATLLIVGAMSVTSTASAYEYDPVGYVTAKSEFGNGEVSGPVRRTSVGLQVRTPGGNWLNCEKSCKDTLRLATIDFWQSEQGAGPDSFISQGQGLFGKFRFGW